MLPARSVFSNPASNAILTSKTVSTESLLKSGNRAQIEARKQKEKGQKSKVSDISSESKQTRYHQPSTHEISDSQVNARLSRLDDKLKAEQERRLQLEGMLREVTRGQVDSQQRTLAMTNHSKTNVEENRVLRVSSKGVPLRRGSQVGTAQRYRPSPNGEKAGGKQYKRYYRHARNMEDDLIKTEEELSICKQELKSTAEALMTVKEELRQRTEELDQSRGKVDSLLRMVKHVLTHLVEKKESRRFSMQASQELQARIAEPLNETFGEGDKKISDYVSDRLAAISDILPRWSAVHGDDDLSSYNNIDSSGTESDSDADIDPDETPPPIPASHLGSRRGNTAGGDTSPATVSLPPQQDEEMRRKALEEALLDFWDAIDPNEDDILSLRELRDNLSDAIPTGPIDLQESVLSALKDGAYLVHDNGAAAFRENDFVNALIDQPFVNELLACALRDGAIEHTPEGLHMDAATKERQTSNNSDKPEDRGNKGKKLSEWSRRQSTHLLPRGVHEHSKTYSS